MTPILNDELQQALRHRGNGPVEIVDPRTNKVYLLIAREQYERIKPLFEEDPITPEEQLELLRQAGRRVGWDDPEMDAYDNYDGHRSKEL